MKSLAVRSGEAEQMDAADLDPATYARILADLEQVNRLTLAHRPTLSFLARATAGMTGFRLLDVGYGGGDLLRRVARWAAVRGLEAELEGVDLNPKSAAVAAAATPAGLPIRYRTGDYADLGSYDVIVSSLVAHHMSEGELVRFVSHMEANARRGWHVNDLHRHRFAHSGYPVLARAVGWHRIVREDGTLSIARAFRPSEWHALLRQAGASDARVYRVFPFRLCVDRLR